jgi:hypothetical protein
VVKLRAPAKPRAQVVKPARPSQRKSKSKPRCVVCGALLRGDHAVGDLVCDCHPTSGYTPHHDPRLDERVLVLLYRARGRPVNLYRALGCDPVSANYDAIDRAVKRLKQSGLVRVVGAGRAGRKLAAISPRSRPRVST